MLLGYSQSVINQLHNAYLKDKTSLLLLVVTSVLALLDFITDICQLNLVTLTTIRNLPYFMKSTWLTKIITHNTLFITCTIVCLCGNLCVQ